MPPALSRRGLDDARRRCRDRPATIARPMRPSSSFGRPLVELRPGLAAVGRLVDAPTRGRRRSASRRGAGAGRRRRSSTSGSRGSITHVGDAGVLADRERRRSRSCRRRSSCRGRGRRRAPRAVPAPRRRRRSSRAGRSRILPMCSEVLRPTFFQLLPPSSRLVDAVAVADAALAVVLAGADPDDVRVLRVDRDAADRVGALAVEDRRPGGARRSRSSRRRPRRRRRTSASCRSGRPRCRRCGRR